jgi:hypothetical protein
VESVPFAVPLVPVIVTTYIPGEMPAQESLAVPEVPRIMLVGKSAQLIPAEGDVVAERLTVPVKPKIDVTVTVEFPAVPTNALTVVGSALMLKPRPEGLTVTVTTRSFTSTPDVGSVAVPCITTSNTVCEETVELNETVDCTAAPAAREGALLEKPTVRPVALMVAERATVPAKPLATRAPEGMLPIVMTAVFVVPESSVRADVFDVMLKSWTRTVMGMLLVFDCPPTVALARILAV